MRMKQRGEGEKVPRKPSTYNQKAVKCTFRRGGGPRARPCLISAESSSAGPQWIPAYVTLFWLRARDWAWRGDRTAQFLAAAWGSAVLSRGLCISRLNGRIWSSLKGFVLIIPRGFIASPMVSLIIPCHDSTSMQKEILPSPRGLGLCIWLTYNGESDLRKAEVQNPRH